MTEQQTVLTGDFIDAVVDDPERARHLLSAQPELLNARWILGETVLHFLAVEGYAEAVQRLAEWGADVNLTNRFGDSPLLDCVLLSNEALVAILLRYGANPNVVSETCGPLLHAAVTCGNPGVVQRLLAAGADPHTRTSIGETVFDALPAQAHEREAMLAIFSSVGIQMDAG